MLNLAAAGRRVCGAIVGSGIERYAQFARQLSPARGWRAQLKSLGDYMLHSALLVVLIAVAIVMFAITVVLAIHQLRHPERQGIIDAYDEARAAGSATVSRSELLAALAEVAAAKTTPTDARRPLQRHLHATGNRGMLSDGRRPGSVL